MRNFLPKVLLGFLVLLLVSLFLSSLKAFKVQAAASHIVISELQITGSTSTTDEFIELYNPTGSAINLTNWSIARKTATGTTQPDIASLSGSIPSHGYFLIGSAGYTGSAVPDVTYSTASGSMASNNTILLKDSSSAIVDLVGLGSAVSSETASMGNPAAGKSIERKANSASTKTSMKIGGSDELLGNSEDTNNNNADFVLRDTPQPQNASSSLEPVPTPTITDTATPTETPTITLTPSPSDSPTPTSTMTPTPTNSPTPTTTLTPTPTLSPTLTLTPTNSPTPTETTMPTTTPTTTVTPTPTAISSTTPTTSPTPTLTPIPTPTGTVILHNGNLICTLTYKTIHIFFLTLTLPQVSCVRI